MSRRRVFALSTGVLLAAGACVPSQGVGTLLDNGGSPSQSSSFRRLSASERDSVVAQAVADREGPRISVYAELSNAASVGARRVRAHFSLDDDAYVLIGQIDADGVVRVVFPTDPTDDGFVRGHRSYQTAEFFAGFTDAFRYRYTTMFRYGLRTPDSYDGAVGYVFAIASWRPMRFDQLSTGAMWDAFELTDEQLMRDPRSAIYELASVLAGANREVYTVKFARYSDTQSLYAGSGYGSSAFGYGYCAGYEPFGFISSPFDVRSTFFGFYPYGSSFSYRGQYYRFDPAGGCYYTQPAYGLWGFTIAQGVPSRPQTQFRRFDLDHGRSPITPRFTPRHSMPVDGTANDAGTGSNIAQTSPQYRQRGLLSADDPGRQPRGREPVVDNGGRLERNRPTIQEMTGRRWGNEGSGSSRVQMGRDDGTIRSTSRPVPMQDRPRIESQSGESRAGSYSRPRPADTPRDYSPRGASASPRTASPRFESPRTESPRSAPAPHVESSRSSPPPSSSGSSSSGSSSSGGGRPTPPPANDPA